MSEFSVGVLCLAEYRSRLAELTVDAKEPCFTKKLNEQWAVLFFEDEWLQKAETVAWLLELSRTVPLLYFAHIEAQGWEYHIFNEGFDIAGAQINYELETEMAIKIAEERYPGEDFVCLLDELYEELEESGTYGAAVAQRLERRNTPSFHLFDVGKRGITRLDNLLNPKTVLETDILVELVDQFRELLRIEEFCWMNYERVEPDEDDIF